VDGGVYAVEVDRTGESQSAVAFAVNGVSQGVAFTELAEGIYFPAASLFTEPQQEEAAAVAFNFGPAFAFPPPDFGELPAPRPMSDREPTTPPAQDKIEPMDTDQACSGDA